MNYANKNDGNISIYDEYFYLICYFYHFQVKKVLNLDKLGKLTINSVWIWKIWKKGKLTINSVWIWKILKKKNLNKKTVILNQDESIEAI